jgi:hypothetical protein
MNSLSKQTRERLVRAFTGLTAVATILSLSGVAYLAPVAHAVAPADYGLTEGDVVSAAGSDDPDVYIVNEMGYKRLFLNPVIFGFYGHLGGFAAVKNVSPATRDAFGTSGLFRNCETDDQKVYGVETTGEDTGMFHWVNTSGAQAVADDPNFFSKVFCINNNEFNWYTNNNTTFGAEYTSVNDVPSYTRGGPTPTPVPAGPLSVMISPNNPAQRTVTLNAEAVEVLVARFTGTGTVNSVTLKRMGAGATADFTNIYVYDGSERVTSGKSLTSSTGKVTFINLNFDVNGTKDMTFVGDMAGTAGNVDYLVLEAASATNSVSGLPVTGNLVEFSGANSGTLDTAKVGSIGDPNVGAKGVQLSEFKVTANTEAASVKRMTLIQGGTVSASAISNVKVTSGTDEWAGVVSGDYLIFDLGSGVDIKKGGNKIFKVWGDVGGKVNETVILYFEENVDLWGIGDQFGFTMAEGTNTLDTSSEAHTLTLQGGTLTITFNGPNAQNIGTDTDDTVFMKFSMTAQANIEIRKTEITLCKDDTGSGTYNNAANAGGWADLDDVKVANEDTGVVMLGPNDGSTFTTTDSGTCEDSATGAQKSFNDVFEINAGETLNMVLTADVKTANTNGTKVDLAATDKIKIVLDDYTDDTPDLTIMKYPDTNTTVADADIVPGSDISSNEFTINAASIKLGLASSPASQTYVKGTKDVDAVGITFAAGQASDMRVTDVTLSGYVRDETSTGTYKLGTDDTDTAVSVANAMTNLRLIEQETGNVVATSGNITSNTLNVEGTGTVKFAFAGSPWTIPAGVTRTLVVRTDLTSNAASGTNGDFYAFDIAATTDVTSLDSASNTVNASTPVAPNGTTSPTKIVTVKNGGSMKIAAHADSPIKGALYWGQQNAPVSKFTMTATDESFFLETFTIAASAAGEIVDAAANVKQVVLTYKNKAGSTLTTTQAFTNTASANFGWTYNGSGTDTRPYVPKDGSLALDVNANLRTKSEGATQTNASPQAVFFSLDFQDTFNNSYTDGFRAVGDGSGTVLDGTSANINDVLGSNDQYVYRVFPKIEQVALPAPYSLLGTPTVFKFSITAMGLADSTLRFDNENIGSGSIYFEVVSSGQETASGAGTSTTFTIYDESNVTIDTDDLRKSCTLGGAECSQTYGSTDANPSYNASIAFDFTSKDVEIAGGTTKTFRIQLNNPGTNYTKTSSTGRAADYFQVTLLDDVASIINWVPNYDQTTNAVDQGSTAGVLRSVPLYGPTFQR